VCEELKGHDELLGRKGNVSRHTVRLKDIVVGWSDLEDAEPNLGRARGRFRPGLGYDLVQPVFQLYARAVPTPGADAADQDLLDRYHRSRDLLDLSLFDDAGQAIRTSAIHISDYSEQKGGSIELEVLIADRDYWNHRS
jgi:hypothetical protein